MSINERKLTESGRTPVFSRKKLNSFPIPHVQEEFFMSTATIAFIEAPKFFFKYSTINSSARKEDSTSLSEVALQFS